MVLIKSKESMTALKMVDAVDTSSSVTLSMPIEEP